jgi:DNA-binding MarR family transcriptional regulator
MSGLDETIHQPIRLRIMAALIALDSGARMRFVDLRDLVGATDGNIGAHIARLEAAGYVRVDKRFVGRKPQTDLRVTDHGRRAFERHVSALKAILGETE